MWGVVDGWRRQNHTRSLLHGNFESLSLSPTTEREKESRGESPNPLPPSHNDPGDCLLCLGFLGNMLHGVRPELVTLTPAIKWLGLTSAFCAQNPLQVPIIPMESSPTPSFSSFPSQISQRQLTVVRTVSSVPTSPVPRH